VADGFASSDDTVARSLADLFLDYGDSYLTGGPLCWSPRAERPAEFAKRR
jgi:hypothetical protein